MKRRRFLTNTAVAGIALLLHERELWSTPMRTARLVLRGAQVYDGTGRRPLVTDVAVEGDRIVGVGRKLTISGAEEIDLRGLALAPGFIDIHSHTDLVLFANPKAESKIRQGVTTEVVGQDGGSMGPWTEDAARRISESYQRRYGVTFAFHDLAGFFRALEQHGSAVNVASMVGTGTIRGTVIGDENRPATPAELARMTQLVSDAIAQGACGLSSGLEYTPGGFATRDELVTLAGALRQTGLPYASHMRNEDDALLGAIEEALAVGKLAGVSVQISHLKAQGQRNWWKTGSAFSMIEQARADGTDVTFDRYPYIAYATGLTNLFPIWARDGGTQAFLQRIQDPALRPRIEQYVRDKIAQLGSWNSVQITSTGDSLAWLRGRKLGDAAQEKAIEPYEFLLDVVIRDNAGTGTVGFGMDENGTAEVLKHSLCMICSDAGASAPYGPLANSSPHPRAYGSFPRVLGHYVREQKLMPLEMAISKMTLMPARRLKLAQRGLIQPGAFADLVAFDPATIADRATFEQPHQYPVGVPHVWVNGKQVIKAGEHTGVLPGKPVRPISIPAQ